MVGGFNSLFFRETLDIDIPSTEVIFLPLVVLLIGL